MMAWLLLAAALAAPVDPPAASSAAVSEASAPAGQQTEEGATVIRVGPPPAATLLPKPAPQPVERQIPSRPAEGATPAPAPIPEPAPAPAPLPPIVVQPQAPANVPVPVYLDFTGPMPEGQPPVVATANPLLAVLPDIRMRGFWDGLLLLVLTLSFASLAQVLGRTQGKLAPTGVFPTVTRLSATLSRVLAAFFALGVLGAWAPASVAPALPFIVIGAAAALGWSARDVLPDLVAWLFIAIEGRVRVGMWVRGPDFSGEVRVLGLRSTVLSDPDGHELMLPNRRLVGQSVHRDTTIWPLVEVVVHAPEGPPEMAIRQALRDASLATPWVAPTPDLEVLADPTGGQRWRVRMRLIEGQYVTAFEGGLRERLLAELAARA